MSLQFLIFRASTPYLLTPLLLLLICSRCSYLPTVGSNEVAAFESNKVAALLLLIMKHYLKCSYLQWVQIKWQQQNKVGAPAAGGKMRLNGCTYNALHCTALNVLLKPAFSALPIVGHRLHIGYCTLHKALHCTALKTDHLEKALH